VEEIKTVVAVVTIVVVVVVVDGKTFNICMF